MKRIEADSDRKFKERDTGIKKFKVYFMNPKTKQMKDQKIFLSHDSTLTETLEEACRILKTKSKYPLNRCRLVAYDNTTEIIERSFEGRENDQVKKLTKIKWTSVRIR